MKARFLICAALLLPALSHEACAQLKLFPSNGRQEVLDTNAVFTAPAAVRVQLRLPLDGPDERKAGYMNFYEGFLMGVRQAAVEGIKVELDVAGASEDMPGESDPYHLVVDASPASQLIQDLQNRREGEWTVVPLEQDIENVADSSLVALVPGTWQDRLSELARWIREEWQFWDKLFILGPGNDGKCEFLKTELKKEGIPFETPGASYLSHDYSTIKGTARFVLVSEDPGFIASAVNFLSGPIRKKKAETALYCTSRVRSYAKRFEEDALGNANTRMVSSYYVDYSSAAVDEFILSFRRYYGAEPNQFAFHGYDTALYFIRLAAAYGEKWPCGIEKDGAPAHGLLTDFRFLREESCKGLVNTAFRRISFDPDLNETMSSTLPE